MISNVTLRSSLALEEFLRLRKKQQPQERMDSREGVPRKVSHKPIRERFLEKVQKTDSCWIWTAKKEKFGYGRFAIREREFAAHRVAYELFVGNIPDGLSIDHLCKNPSCVNPEHLEPVTMRVNLLRGNTFQARNASKTHCPQGHPYSGDNLIFKSGGRTCRACRIQKKREARSKIKTT